MKDRFKDRINELHALGLKFSGQYESYLGNDGINVHWTDMTVLDDAQWGKMISEIKNRLPVPDNTDPYCISQIA